VAHVVLALHIGPQVARADGLVRQLRAGAPAAESAQIVVPGRNANGSQPNFPEVPGLTVAALQENWRAACALRFAP
jgi:hypothetical protein